MEIVVAAQMVASLVLWLDMCVARSCAGAGRMYSFCEVSE